MIDQGWTRDVTIARRSEWNAEIKKLGANCSPRDIQMIIDRLGYDVMDIRYALKMYSIK